MKRGAASASAMGLFETAMLTWPENLWAQIELQSRRINVVLDCRRLSVVTLDMDSSESPVLDEQEGAMWNCHLRSK